MATLFDGADKYARMSKEVRGAVAKALFEEASNIHRESQRLVPVDTGVLRSTGIVEVNAEGLNFKISYGGPAAPYAARQHEDLSYKHTTGQAKYLEEPFLAAKDGMESRVGKRVLDLIAR